MKYRLIPLLVLALSVLILSTLPNSVQPITILQKDITYNPEVEKVYQKALQDYQLGRYDMVIWELEELIKVFPQNHRITSILYLIGRSQYKLHKNDAASKTLHLLQKQYPKSQLWDDAEYLLAAIEYRRGLYSKVLDKLLHLVKHSDDSRLKQKATILAYQLLQAKYSASDLETVTFKYKDSTYKPILLLAKAAQFWKAGKTEQAKRLVNQFKLQYKQSILIQEADSLAKRLQQAPAGVVKIGIILPFSGYFAEEANAIYQGIQLALEETAGKLPVQIKLEVRDSRGRVVEAIRNIQQLCADPKVIAVIGELESEPTAAIGVVADQGCQTNKPASGYGLAPTDNNGSLVVLAPVATETGIASLGNNIFQLVPDVRLRGEKIAQFAMLKQGLKSFAILAPADDYGWEITDSFAATVDRLGGQIVAESWYYESAVNVKPQFRHIREIGFEKMIRDSVSVAEPSLSISQIDSIVSVIKQQKLERLLSESKGKLADSTAYPITSIDGMFLPIYSEDIKYVAPQFALFNIQAQILGGEFWNDKDVLDDNRSYVDGAIFASGYFLNDTDPAFRTFRDHFRKRFGRTPGKLEVFGYDTFMFLNAALQQRAFSRQSILQTLLDIKTFKGLHGTFHFGEKSRVNSNVNILQYANGVIRKLQ